jgi:hypothetical protein
MSQHEVLAAAIFVVLSLSLTALFDFLERRYKRNHLPPHKTGGHNSQISY